MSNCYRCRLCKLVGYLIDRPPSANLVLSWSRPTDTTVVYLDATVIHSSLYPNPCSRPPGLWPPKALTCRLPRSATCCVESFRLQRLVKNILGYSGIVSSEVHLLFLFLVMGDDNIGHIRPPPRLSIILKIE